MKNCSWIVIILAIVIWDIDVRRLCASTDSLCKLLVLLIHHLDSCVSILLLLLTQTAAKKARLSAIPETLRWVEDMKFSIPSHRCPRGTDNYS